MKKNTLIIIGVIYGCAALAALITLIVGITNLISIGNFSWSWVVFWGQFVFYFFICLVQILYRKKRDGA